MLTFLVTLLLSLPLFLTCNAADANCQAYGCDTLYAQQAAYDGPPCAVDPSNNYNLELGFYFCPCSQTEVLFGTVTYTGTDNGVTTALATNSPVLYPSTFWSADLRFPVKNNNILLNSPVTVSGLLSWYQHGQDIATTSFDYSYTQSTTTSEFYTEYVIPSVVTLTGTYEGYFTDTTTTITTTLPTSTTELYLYFTTTSTAGNTLTYVDTIFTNSPVATVIEKDTTVSTFTVSQTDVSTIPQSTETDLCTTGTATVVATTTSTTTVVRTVTPKASVYTSVVDVTSSITSTSTRTVTQYQVTSWKPCLGGTITKTAPAKTVSQGGASVKALLVTRIITTTSTKTLSCLQATRPARAARRAGLEMRAASSISYEEPNCFAATPTTYTTATRYSSTYWIRTTLYTTTATVRSTVTSMPDTFTSTVSITNTEHFQPTTEVTITSTTGTQDTWTFSVTSTNFVTSTSTFQQLVTPTPLTSTICLNVNALVTSTPTTTSTTLTAAQRQTLTTTLQRTHTARAVTYITTTVTPVSPATTTLCSYHYRTTTVTPTVTVGQRPASTTVKTIVVAHTTKFSGGKPSVCRNAEPALATGQAPLFKHPVALDDSS